MTASAAFPKESVLAAAKKKLAELEPCYAEAKARNDELLKKSSEERNWVNLALLRADLHGLAPLGEKVEFLQSLVRLCEPCSGLVILDLPACKLLGLL